jgi:chorismate mutase
MRAIRGAITVSENSKQAILEATEELLNTIIRANHLTDEEIISIIFTATDDLDKVYPALAARQLGLHLVPLLCFQEMKVINSLKKCIRVMVYIDRDCGFEEINHVYLRDAVILRPDLIGEEVPGQNNHK